MRTITKSNAERDFFSFMSKRKKYADVLPVLAQNKRIYTWHIHNSPNFSFRRKKLNRSSSMKKLCQSFQAQERFCHRTARSSSLEYTMLAHSFTKDQNKQEYLPLFGFSVTLPLPRKVPDVTKEQIYVDAISQ